MTKKPFVAFSPLVVVAAFVLMPGAAQAAGPHWLKAGAVIKEGVKTPVLIHGGATNLSEMNNVGETNRKDAGGGTIENPAGDRPGIGTIDALGFYECKSAGCEKAGAETGMPLTIEIEWNNAPVSLSLIGEGASEHETIGEPFTKFNEYRKLVTKGEVQMRLACERHPAMNRTSWVCPSQSKARSRRTSAPARTARARPNRPC